jgi:predicted transcriptional regulator
MEENEEKTVGQLMVSLREYATIDAGKTIKEALEALSKAQLGLTEDRHHHRAVLVLDRSGNVVGKLSHWAILRALERSPLRTDDVASLSRAGLSEDFIQSMQDSLSAYAGSFRQLCRYAARVKAADAMVPVGESIHESATLTDAIHMLVRKHVQSLPVTRGDRVVGILRLSDVFEEVKESIKESG